ncbi:hypothetical protein AVEN_267833-1 [Araneus ventricosus]|uniref:Neurotransmitter-gated ion-channel ligand-binding domain-containing protein n=1 Tax=Araneus ventricosus TaxID=182803 RepID=A0A4Y2D3D7_ARAVE|nr:hypothetical protein AVEN_267833-1 [Araneus ventricosus]
MIEATPQHLLDCVASVYDDLLKRRFRVGGDEGERPHGAYLIQIRRIRKKRRRRRENVVPGIISIWLKIKKAVESPVFMQNYQQRCIMFSEISVMIIINVIMATARDENEYRLTKYLLSNYDKSVRPARHTSEPVNVTFGLALTQIIDVDERNQILTTNCWLNQVMMLCFFTLYFRTIGDKNGRIKKKRSLSILLLK